MGSLMNIQCVSLLCIFLLNMSACEGLKPPSVPDAIAVPSGRKAVRGFSGKGTIKYSFDGSQWQVDQMRGKLDNIGSFYSNGKPDSHRSDFYLQTRNPNGWTVVGFITASITLSDSAIPWLLFKVTSSSGNVSLQGPFTYFQMLDPKGKNPPKSPGVTSWTGEFSAQFWIYK